MLGVSQSIPVATYTVAMDLILKLLLRMFVVLNLFVTFIQPVPSYTCELSNLALMNVVRHRYCVIDPEARCFSIQIHTNFVLTFMQVDVVEMGRRENKAIQVLTDRNVPCIYIKINVITACCKLYRY